MPNCITSPNCPWNEVWYVATFFLLVFHSHVCVLSCFSHVRLFETPWTVACQAPLPIGFSKQEDWSRLPMPSSRGSSQPKDRTASLGSPVLAGGFFTSTPFQGLKKLQFKSNLAHLTQYPSTFLPLPAVITAKFQRFMPLG